MSSPIVRKLRSVFQTRDLSLLWAGQVISMSGDSIYQIALLWLALELTASKAITAPVLFLITGIVGGLYGLIGLLFAKQLRRQS